MKKQEKNNGESYCEFDGNCKPDTEKKQLKTEAELEDRDRPEAGQLIRDWIIDPHGAIDVKEKEGGKPGKSYCSWDGQCGEK